MPKFPDSLRTELRALVGNDYLVEAGDTLEMLSKDYYWCSPALRPLLDDKRADVVAKPGTVDELRTLIADEFATQITDLMSRYPGEVLIHLEWGAGDPSRAIGTNASPDAIAVGGIPLIRYTTAERFHEIVAEMRRMGVTVSDTHTYHLTATTPEGTLARHTLKREVDPRGLMNPGKMHTFPLNPFVAASSS